MALAVTVAVELLVGVENDSVLVCHDRESLAVAENQEAKPTVDESRVGSFKSVKKVVMCSVMFLFCVYL